MNPFSKIPEKARLIIYSIYAAGIPTLAYTRARGWTGQAEQDLWLGYGVAFGIVAASNVGSRSDD